MHPLLLSSHMTVQRAGRKATSFTLGTLSEISFTLSALSGAIKRLSNLVLFRRQSNIFHTQCSFWGNQTSFTLGTLLGNRADDGLSDETWRGQEGGGQVFAAGSKIGRGTFGPNIFGLESLYGACMRRACEYWQPIINQAGLSACQ